MIGLIILFEVIILVVILTKSVVRHRKLAQKGPILQTRLKKIGGNMTAVSAIGSVLISKIIGADQEDALLQLLIATTGLVGFYIGLKISEYSYFDTKDTPKWIPRLIKFFESW